MKYSDLSINQKINFKHQVVLLFGFEFFKYHYKRTKNIYLYQILPREIRYCRILNNPNHKAVGKRIINKYINSILKKYGAHLPYLYDEKICNRWKTYNQKN